MCRTRRRAAQVAALKNEQSTLLTERTRIAQSEPDLTIHPAVLQTNLGSLPSVEAALRGARGSAEANEFAVIGNVVQYAAGAPNASSTPRTEVEGDLARFLVPRGSSSGGNVVAGLPPIPRLEIPLKFEV